MVYTENDTILKLLGEVRDSSKILEQNKAFIFDHEAENKVNGVALGTRITKVYVGLRLGLFVKKPFNELTVADVRGFLSQHIPRSASNYRDRTRQEYSPRTMILHKIHLKSFLKWVFGFKKKDQYPECVEWLYTGRPKDVPLTSLKPQNVLTKTDILKLIEKSNNSRDAALIHTMYETGCRDGEWRTISFSDLQIDERIAKVEVNGKTGKRTVYLVKSFPRLRDWLNVHPLKHKPDFPIWVAFNNYGETGIINSGSWRKKLNVIKKRAKILIPVNPHAFRHAAATEDAKNGWNEAMMRKKYGWSSQSNMPSLYIHLANTDIEDKILKEAGLKPKVTIQDKILDFQICPRCNKEWSAGTKFCVCGNILDITTAIDFEETRKKDDQTVKNMTERMITMQQKMQDIFEEIDQIRKQKIVLEATK